MSIPLLHRSCPFKIPPYKASIDVTIGTSANKCLEGIEIPAPKGVDGETRGLDKSPLQIL